jgi:hypothetical protein
VKTGSDADEEIWIADTLADTFQAASGPMIEEGTRGPFVMWQQLGNELPSEGTFWLGQQSWYR